MQVARRGIVVSDSVTSLVFSQYSHVYLDTVCMLAGCCCQASLIILMFSCWRAVLSVYAFNILRTFSKNRYECAVVVKDSSSCWHVVNVCFGVGCPLSLS